MRQQSAIHWQDLRVDEPSLLGGQKYYGGADILGSSRAGRQNVLGIDPHLLGREYFGQALMHDQARGYGVAAYALLAVERGNRPGQGNHGRLGGAVGRNSQLATERRAG